MSIFKSILAKLFPANHPAVTASPASPAGATAPVPGATTAPSAGAPAPTAAAQPVDVEKILNERAASHAEKLNWRTSIVDLMKLLDLDSSLAARKSLASELHFSGDSNDSSAMNIWLHRQVMTKLAQNGGKVPDDLKD